MVARPALAFAALFFTAGAIVLTLFTLLPGAVNKSVALNNVFFLSADTSGIQGAPKISQWTLWNICDGSTDGINANCGAVKPAYPFDPPRNFATTNGVPQDFVNVKKFFYISRFMFAFILIGLFFAVLSLVMGFGALCFRIGGAVSGLMATFALFWQSAASALMTACFVIGRNNFRKNNQASDIGTKAFGFMWAATACLFLATILYFGVLSTGKRDATRTSRRGIFGRKKSTRSRGSFIGNDRVIKDDETTSFERSR